MSRRAAAELGMQTAEQPHKRQALVLLGNEDERLRQWSFFKRGILLNSGGLAEQDADYVTDMLTLDGLYGEEFEKVSKARPR